MKKFFLKILSVLILACLLVGIGYFLYAYTHGIRLFEFQIKDNKEIDITPMEISSIRQIGEWEFLSIETEELIDSVKKGIFFDDRMISIYRAHVSMGIDMSTFQKEWTQVSGDTLFLTLPQVDILDDEFINEAQTEVFYETGTWTAQDKEDLYQRAHHRILQRTRTPQIQKSAEENARNQITAQMQALGFKQVEIRFR